MNGRLYCFSSKYRLRGQWRRICNITPNIIRRRWGVREKHKHREETYPVYHLVDKNGNDCWSEAFDFTCFDAFKIEGGDIILANKKS